MQQLYPPQPKNDFGEPSNGLKPDKFPLLKPTLLIDGIVPPINRHIGLNAIGNLPGFIGGREEFPQEIL
jgi:hypothetical protein